jgi:hypothetical protein
MTDPFFFRHRHDRRLLYASGVAVLVIAALLWWVL